MKRILSFISIILVTFLISFSTSNAWWFDISVIFWGGWWWWWDSIPYCQWSECWLEKGVEAVKDIDAVETKRSASEWIQAVVKYILWFLMLLATLIIIYAWFVLMLWLWDEEKAKKTKMIMMYAVIWLVIIYLAWPLTDFIFNILNS